MLGGVKIRDRTRWGGSKADQVVCVLTKSPKSESTRGGVVAG